MAIIFGGDVGIVENSFSGFLSEVNKSLNNFIDTATGKLHKGGPPPPPVEKVYVETGFSNVPGTSFIDSTIDNIDDIQTRRITTQEPSLTLYIKKRAFWALGSDNDSRFMDSGEKLFMRASKIMFEKKCNQIASYEALTKMSSLISEDAHLDATRIQKLIEFSLDFMNLRVERLEADAAEAISTDPTNFAFTDGIITQLNKLKQNVDSGRPLVEALIEMQSKQNKLNQATNTTWVIDPDQSDVFQMGRGSGVIELTLVNSIDTSLGISVSGSISEGRVNFSVQDPYGLMRITTDDVEVALASAYREVNNLLERGADGEFLALQGPSVLLEEARKKERYLKSLREDRISASFGISKTAIGNSKLPEIIFEINQTSYAPNRVIAYSSITEIQANDLNSLRASMINLPIEQQIDLKEGRVVDEIFKLLHDYLDAVSRLNQKILDANKKEDVAYARRNLRIHYLGKWIVQPMDSVHVYMRGNTYKEGAVIGPLSGLLNNSQFIQNASKDRDVSDAVLREEMKQFEIDILDVPLDFYKAVRTGSFMRNAGMHVFGGLINNVSETYNASNGTYVLNASGTSNIGWLKLSRTATKPALAQPNGMLEDPLTPFKFNLDPATGLIKEKPELLPANALALSNLKDKHGTYRGETAKPENHEQDLVKIGDKLQPVYRHIPGMVYKWKPGVMVASTDINLEKSLQGEPEEIQALDRTVGLKVVDKPFAGLDAADIISLLVTGYPHSADRFYKSATNVGTFTNAGTNAAPSFFHSFFDITQTTNRSLGNFKPFRSIDIDGSLLIQQMKLLGSFQKNYAEIDRLRSELAKERDKLKLVSNITIGGAGGATDSLFERIEEREQHKKTTLDIIDNLKAKLDAEVKQVTEAEAEAKAKHLIKDTDKIAFNDEFLPSGPSDDANNEMRQNVRLKNKITQLRTQYDCKFNSDENLLVISDEYDQNVNIQAYITKMLSGEQQLFNSGYEFPLDICVKVADTLNFEFYCNSQGHLCFRPPQYNRVPLSLLLKMFMLKDKEGIQLYPDFLKSLFESRLSSTRNETQSVNAQIRIWSLLLDIEKTPEELVVEITSGKAEEEIIGGQFFSPNRSAEIDSSQRATEIAGLSRSVESYSGNKNKLSDIVEAEKEIVKFNDPNSQNINVIRLDATNKLKQLLSRKEQLDSMVKKLEIQESKYTTNIKDFSKEKLNDILAPFENLIEDDYNDFLGPGSSKRFIIYNEQIISSTFTENSANADCRVDVQGEHNLVGGPGALVPNIPSIWAGATDFDLWRQYGYKSMGTVNKPFLKDAETQCAPYALFLLSRARRDVMRGTITVYGNEYYQLGDVVYINSRDQLFYVTDVSHKFAYDGGIFTTTLTLRYGHTLGDYIPTPFDVIGQGLIKNQRKFNEIIVTRKTVSREFGVHLGMVIFQDNESDDEHKAMLTEPFARFNINELKRSLLMASNYITTSSDENKFPKVEIRGWYKDEANKSKVQNRMDAVISWLGFPRGRWIEYNEHRYIKLGTQYDNATLESNQIHNNTSQNPIKPVELVKDKKLEDDNWKFSRIPSEEVYNVIPPGKAGEEKDPTNIIEIVLIFGQEDEEE